MENDMDLHLSLPMEFSDIISFSGLLCASPTPPQDHENENSPASSQRFKVARDAVAVIDDPHLEASSLAVTKPQRKGRKPKHNFSEKKRRERIQTKFKLLRELIPNSQKLDSASLLGEAISHIKDLKCKLQMVQSQFSYTNVPPYNLQFTRATPISPFMITGMNDNFTTMHQPLYVPLPRFSAPVARNVIPMQFLPPNRYYFDHLPGSSTAAMQQQLQTLPVHASYQKEMTERTLNEK